MDFTVNTTHCRLGHIEVAISNTNGEPIAYQQAQEISTAFENFLRTSEKAHHFTECRSPIGKNGKSDQLKKCLWTIYKTLDSSQQATGKRIEIQDERNKNSIALLIPNQYTHETVCDCLKVTKIRPLDLTGSDVERTTGVPFTDKRRDYEEKMSGIAAKTLHSVAHTNGRKAGKRSAAKDCKQKTTQMIRNAAGLVRRGKLGAAVGPKELVKGLANILKTAY